MSGMSGKAFLLLFMFFSLSFAGDENKEVTELCGFSKVDSLQWFSLSLVELMFDSVKTEKSRQFIFEHHNGKRTVVSYDAKKKIFFVKRNYESKENPTQEEDLVTEKVKDPLTGRMISVEWQN